MANRNLTTETEQFILNRAKNATYNTIDTTPFVETTQGSVAQQVTGTVSGAKVLMDVNVAAGGAGDGSILDGVDTGIKATVLDYTSSNPLAVRLTDTAGDYVGAGAGTQYTEDAAAAANPVGTALNMVRADALAAVTTTDGDNIAARGTNNGELYVKHVDAIAVTGTFWQATQPVSLASVPSHAVTNVGTFAVQVDGAALTSLQLADDVVATLGTTTYTEATTKGTTIGAVRRDADTTLVDTTNEIGPLQMNALGQLKVEVFSGEALPVTLTSTTITGTVAVTQSGTWDEVGINDSGNSITVDGTITEANSAAIAASLSVLDDWDETDRAKVNPIAGQAGVQGAAGAVTALTQRVVLATDQTVIPVTVTSGLTTIGHGVKTVTTAGTDVALAGSTACKRVTIQAQTDNLTAVAIGATGVDATISTGNGIILMPGDVYELEIDNLADVFVDSLTNGEGVRFTYFT